MTAAEPTGQPIELAIERASAPVLELSAVRAGYGRIDVLHGVDLSLAPGEVYALLGPNGAGKSTTLAVASGQIVPSSGSLMLCGRDVTGVTPDALARAGVCLIPEGRGIFPNLTVIENLRMATFTGTNFHEVQDRVFTQFPRLRERRRQTAGTLSGGEQQMLSMGRALATDPAVLLIDELSMGLAPLIVEELYDHVRRIAASGLSILIVEQFAHEILGVADLAGIMLHGNIVETGTPTQIADDLTSAYLGGTHH
jgi:branched-chain amino acid transport system ATP-binding protein